MASLHSIALINIELTNTEPANTEPEICKLPLNESANINCTSVTSDVAGKNQELSAQDISSDAPTNNDAPTNIEPEVGEVPLNKSKNSDVAGTNQDTSARGVSFESPKTRKVSVVGIQLGGDEEMNYLIKFSDNRLQMFTSKEARKKFMNELIAFYDSKTIFNENGVLVKLSFAPGDVLPKDYKTPN